MFRADDVVNPDMVNDPTLPRTRDVTCPKAVSDFFDLLKIHIITTPIHKCDLMRWHFQSSQFILQCGHGEAVYSQSVTGANEGNFCDLFRNFTG